MVSKHQYTCYFAITKIADNKDYRKFFQDNFSSWDEVGALRGNKKKVKTFSI